MLLKSRFRPFTLVLAVLLSGRLLPAADPLRVRVLDAHGAAVPNAVVEVLPAGGGTPLASKTTGMDGVAQFEMRLPAEMRVTAQGFEPVRKVVPVTDASETTVRLRPAILRTSVDVVVRDDTSFGPAVATPLEIDRTGARTVFDAVEQLVPGAFVTRRGVMGYGIATNGTGGVSIRGIGEQPNTGVLVVVDGRPDFQGLMGHSLPDFYSLSDAESVVVTKGPASVLYGSNAMGGVIEVKPSRPSAGMHTRLSSSLGSYLTGEHRLANGTQFEKFFYSATAGISHTGGDRPGSAFRNQNGTFATGYDFSPVWKASVEGRYGHFHVEDPGPVNAPLADSYARVGRGGFSVSVDDQYSRIWGSTRLFSSYGNHFITDGFRSVDNTTGVHVDQHFSVSSRLTLEAGSDIASYGGRARNVTTRQDYGDHHLDTGAGFTRAQWSPTARLHLNSGVRYEHNSQAGGIVVPEFGGAYAIGGGYSVGVEAARGFRNPTIRELYLFPAPNPLLKPERLWNYQASFHAHPVQSLTASATVYYADLSDLIITTGRYPFLALSNAGRALNRGIESSVRWRVQKRLSFQSGYALLHSTNLAPYIPAQKWDYSADFDAGRAQVHFGGTSVGMRWADVNHSRKLDRYTLGTLRIGVPLNRAASLFTMVDNLFNRRYEVVPGYPMPGINALGGFQVNF